MQIIFDQVSKKYGLVTALDSINVKIEPGEFVFIAGPSGSGKSTLLKLILNQIKPSSGTINVNNIDLSRGKRNQIDKIRRSTGVIFQDYQLVIDKNIEENIALALDIVSFPRQQFLNRIDEVLKSVGLSNRRYQFPSQLSGGELQRAALARALAVDPQLILADEPTGNLDMENSWNLVKLLKEINDRLKTTIIMTTHNLDIIDSFKRRVLYLRHGVLEKDTENDLSSSPTTQLSLDKTPKLKKKKKLHDTN